MRQNFATSRSPRTTGRPLIMGRTGTVTAGHYLATAAGMEIMRSGGNAIDAGVAAGVAINVLLFDRASFGGVAPIILYHAATGSLVTLDGLGVWPELADAGEIGRRRVDDGILRSVTPGALDAWLTALERYGTMSLGEVLEPAWLLARHGAPIARWVAEGLARREAGLDSMDPEAAAIFFPGGRAPRPGQILVQADLARTIGALIAEESRARTIGLDRAQAIRRARDYFYRGPIAERIAAYHEQHGGWMRAADLAAHRVEVAPSLHVSYRGYDVHACGPWCQGPMLLQFLTLLDNFDLERLDHNSARYCHLLIEAMDLVFADRENFYGDPRQIAVPIEGLLSPDYARDRAGGIALDRATGRMPDPGNPWRYQAGGPSREVCPVDVDRYRTSDDEVKSDTSYVAAADASGNVFSATPSDPVFWTPVIPSLGFSCSGRGTQSRTDPDHPSRIMPGGRPRLTPNPALVMQGGRPVIGLGCPGGDAQTQAMLQVFLNVVHFGMNPQEAIEAPRVISRNFPNSFAPHVYHPGRMEAEPEISEQVRRELTGLGHDLQPVDRWSASSASVHMVVVNPIDGTLLAGSDPRTEGSASGW